MREKSDWFDTAVIYSLDVRSFKDGNQDGMGDLKGLIANFDHLIDLGVSCLWMSPINRSSGHDDGYDVVDYYQIDPILGDFSDFDHLVKKAKSSGIKILLDLVVNHTSVDHPWFQQAISQPGSRHYDYYIWEKRKPENDKEDVVFKTVEHSNWEYEPAVDSFFYHTFYKHQPDLNVTNPDVQAEILAIIDFWMAKGIDGFRIDAVPHILRDKGDCQFEGDPYELLAVWDRQIKKHNHEAILVGEADVEPEGYASFIKEGKLNGLFNFFVNNYTFLAFATQRAAPLYEALSRLPMANGRHYLNFIRNHDELDLERLTDQEREQVFRQFAPDPSMIIYERGIRRRLPPMVNNDARRIKLAMSLLITLPGVPVIRYGEEIGMGDDLNRPERKSVRTAMQWSDQRNGGFSDVAPNAMRYPLIREGSFGYQHINVVEQAMDDNSLLTAVKAMIHIRNKEHAFFAGGHFTVVHTDNDAVLAYCYDDEGQPLFVIHNFADRPQHARITWKVGKTTDIQLLLGDDDVTISGGQLSVGLHAYAYSWFRLDELC